jgi:hypothetical protein
MTFQISPADESGLSLRTERISYDARFRTKAEGGRVEEHSGRRAAYQRLYERMKFCSH